MTPYRGTNGHRTREDDEAPVRPARTMAARFPSTCVATGQRIEPGDTITYVRGVGATLVARRYVSDVIQTSGGTFYRNRQGRCEDAPCCGCCTI